MEQSGSKLTGASFLVINDRLTDEPVFFSFLLTQNYVCDIPVANQNMCVLGMVKDRAVF